MSAPFLSVDGYYIVKIKSKTAFISFEEIEQQLCRNILKKQNIKELYAINTSNGNTITPIEQQTTTLSAPKTIQQKNKKTQTNTLYSDDMALLCALNAIILNNCDKDKNKLEQYFNSHKKNYIFANESFKGYVLYAQNKYQLKELKKKVKHLSLTTIDSLKIKNLSSANYKVEGGVFTKGENAIVDYHFFKNKKAQNTSQHYPFTTVVGKKYKKANNINDVYNLVLADYKEWLEQQWLETLKKKEVITINKEQL